MSDLKPVVFKIVLDTADAQKALDALRVPGGGRGRPDGGGRPVAPRPYPDDGGRIPGEEPGPKPPPGRGRRRVPGLPDQYEVPGQPNRGAPFNTFLGTVNRAVLNPVGVAEGAAAGALGTTAAAAGIIATSAIFLEQVVPVVLNKLAESLPDMPFFKEYARQFDDMVSDRLTEIRTWITSLIPAIQETAQINRAVLLSGGKITEETTLGVGRRLFEITRQQKRLNADVEKEIDKKIYSGLIDALVEGIK